jgi:hypothetical protein
MARYDTRNDAALVAIAHCGPIPNSSGPANGGPTTAATAADACEYPAARPRWPSGTTSPITTNRAALKNCATAVLAATTTPARPSSTGRPTAPAGRPATMASTPIRPARIRSARSITARKSRHRSTSTPAAGPTSSVVRDTTARTAPLTIGACRSPRSRTVATHSSTAVSNTKSPVKDTVLPAHSQA